MEWDALMRLGLAQLRLQPRQFWRLTPYELQVMAGLDDRLLPMSRGQLSDLERAYPDAPSIERNG